jgi:hypothetical protein
VAFAINECLRLCRGAALGQLKRSQNINAVKQRGDSEFVGVDGMVF